MHSENIFPIERAEELLDQLNSEPDDDWTYKLVRLSETHAKIAVYDETDTFIANL